MKIDSRMIVSGAAAFALAGAVLWGSAVVLTSPPAAQGAVVEVSALDEKAWMVDVQDIHPIGQESLTAATH